MHVSHTYTYTLEINIHTCTTIHDTHTTVLVCTLNTSTLIYARSHGFGKFGTSARVDMRYLGKETCFLFSIPAAMELIMNLFSSFIRKAFGKQPRMALTFKLD